MQHKNNFTQQRIKRLKKQASSGKILSMRTFLQQVQAIAKRYGKTYSAVSTEMNINSRNTLSIEYRGYIDGCRWYYCPTPNEVLQKLEKELSENNTETSKDDVVIDNLSF